MLRHHLGECGRHGDLQYGCAAPATNESTPEGVQRFVRVPAAGCRSAGVHVQRQPELDLQTEDRCDVRRYEVSRLISRVDIGYLLLNLIGKGIAGVHYGNLILSFATES